MGLWQGTTLNTNATSVLINKFYNNEAQDIVSETSGLVFSLLNKASKTNPSFNPAKQRVNKIDGDKLVVRLFGALTPIGTLGDGAPEMANQNPSYNSAAFGATVFDITHYYKLFGMPSSEYRRFVGDDAKTVNWIAEKTMEMAGSMRDQWATDVNARAVGGTRTVLGNWQHAVSDGTTNVAGFNETLLKTYGTLDRSDNANGDYRGKVLDINGAWDLTHLDKAKVRANRKNSLAKGTDLVLCGEAQFLRAQSLLNGKPQVLISQDETWRKWGGMYFQYSGMTFIYEPKLPDDVMGVLDSSTWVLWDENPDKLVEEGFTKNPFGPSKLAEVDKWTSILCVSPGNNAKLIRLT